MSTIDLRHLTGRSERWQVQASHPSRKRATPPPLPRIRHAASCDRSAIIL